VGHAAVRAGADGLADSGDDPPGDVFLVACDNAEVLMHASASGHGSISRSTADGTSIAGRDRGPRLERRSR
jgi:hypothetical protein